MKAKQTGLKALLLLFIIPSLFLFSCSTKKSKPEEMVSKPPTAAEDEAGKDKKGVRIREQDLSEQEKREKALREEEARRQKEAAEKARFESEDIYFDFDQYLLSDSSKQTLNKKGQWMKKYPAIRALIEGHCDERGSAEYNMALGQRRADAAMQYLIALGVSADRLSTISYGKEKPIVPRSTEEAWAKNRRAHFVLK